MKCVDSFLYGVAFGMLVASLVFVYVTEIAKSDAKPKASVCELSVGDLNHTHVRYGVVIQSNEGE